tara:strand:- start:1355 stop:1603 length:249 start_codon:yes stop_codon:yes gene_type:complete
VKKKKVEDAFHILDTIDSIKEDLEELHTFRRELFFMGTPRNEKLEAILNRTIKLVILHTEAKMKQIDKLELQLEKALLKNEQ